MPASERMKALRYFDKFNLNEFSLFDSEEGLLEMLATRVMSMRIIRRPNRVAARTAKPFVSFVSGDDFVDVALIPCEADLCIVRMVGGNATGIDAQKFRPHTTVLLCPAYRTRWWPQLRWRTGEPDMPGRLAISTSM